MIVSLLFSSATACTAIDQGDGVVGAATSAGSGSAGAGMGSSGSAGASSGVAGSMGAGTAGAGTSGGSSGSGGAGDFDGAAQLDDARGDVTPLADDSATRGERSYVDAALDATSGPVSHRFLSAISDGGPVALVAKDGHIEWQYDVATEANDAWLLPNGNIVFAYKSGAQELTPTKQVVWNYTAPTGSEVHSCQPLPNGGYLLGEAHPAGLGYLREIDAAGRVQKTVTIIAAASLSTHGQFREVRKTPQDTYLVTYLDLNKAREVDAAGKVLREFPCGSFVAIRLPDGNTLIACGDDHRVIEVDPQNNIVWQVTQSEIPGNKLGFAAGLQRLPNGNTIICNWPGHGGDPSQPQAFELTRDKRVVWQVKNPLLKMISNLEVVDPEASMNGVVLR